jgi:hypothetical protein
MNKCTLGRQFLLYCSLFIPAVNKEQYNKNCQSTVHLLVHYIQYTNKVNLFRDGDDDVMVSVMKQNSA